MTPGKIPSSYTSAIEKILHILPKEIAEDVASLIYQPTKAVKQEKSKSIGVKSSIEDTVQDTNNSVANAVKDANNSSANAVGAITQSFFVVQAVQPTNTQAMMTEDEAFVAISLRF